jgi:hypothetical protein
MTRDNLNRISDLSGVADLFVHLGYVRANDEFSHGARVLARWKSFKVVGIESATASDTARALARRLGTNGERGLAIALGPGVLSVVAPCLGTTATTRVLTVVFAKPTPFALEQLQSLRPRKSGTALSHMLRIIETLSTEIVSDRFFAEFRTTMEGMVASLDGRRTVADRRMAALLALTRILFLYFIQTKGWLAGKRDYLRGLLEAALVSRRHFHRSTLDPLFFGTLNQPSRKRPPGNGSQRIPYLNGGLFEPHPVERRIGPVHFSNELWRDAFERLFDRFRFCVREDDEVDAIAPDMLGRVFERLMHTDERIRTGTFYTPETVVRDIVKATLATALAGIGGLSETTAQQVMSGGGLAAADRVPALAALRQLRVLDPAAGSGAFLLGALDLLTEATLSVAGPSVDRWSLRRRILRENLFGVDLNPIAVRLAELRLWLAVVADDPTTDIAKINPLPNLDGVVRQGDTLLDPVGAVRSLGIGVSSDVLGAVRRTQAARARLFDAQGTRGRRALNLLRAAEHRLAHAMLTGAADSVNCVLRELEDVAASPDLFGTKSGLTLKQRVRYRLAQNNLTDLERALTALGNGALPFFAFEVHAPDVMADGGFHVVVGNPPWVRAERLAPSTRNALGNRFSWWRTDTSRGFQHQPDLALAFLQRSLEVTAAGGAVGLLLPSKIASADYGRTARRHMVRDTTITYLHRLPDREAARFGATTYPLAMVCRKSPPSPTNAARLSFTDLDSVRQATLAESGPWVLVPDRIQEAVEHFRQSGPPLQESAAPALGVKTGADAVLVGEVVRSSDKTALVRFGNTEIEVERSVLRRALRGRDVRPFRAQARRVVLWGYDGHGKPTAKLPPLAARWVQRHRDRLLARADYVGGVTWRLFRTQATHASHRVVWRDIARRPSAALLDLTDAPDAVPLNSCYVAPFRNRQSALTATAVINSSWAAALAAVTADEARGGYRRINARVVRAMPTVFGEWGRILAALSARAHEGGHVSQRDLDEAVAAALDLPGAVQDRLLTLVDRSG